MYYEKLKLRQKAYELVAEIKCLTKRVSYY